MDRILQVWGNKHPATGVNLEYESPNESPAFSTAWTILLHNAHAGYQARCQLWSMCRGLTEISRIHIMHICTRTLWDANLWPSAPEYLKPLHLTGARIRQLAGWWWHIFASFRIYFPPISSATLCLKYKVNYDQLLCITRRVGHFAQMAVHVLKLYVLTKYVPNLPSSNLNFSRASWYISSS